MPTVSLVVAMARNGVIGRDNALPWRLPADLKHFKSVTMGKPVLMGRKTFASIGKPLPGRTNLVLTRDAAWRAEGAIVVHSVAEALDRIPEAPELAGIGGADVFRLLLPLASRIYLTRVEAEIPGDTVFPPIDLSQWLELEQRKFAADEGNPYDMTFMTLQRAAADAR
jgi:dihydrofolate reductase